MQLSVQKKFCILPLQILSLLLPFLVILPFLILMSSLSVSAASVAASSASKILVKGVVASSSSIVSSSTVPSSGGGGGGGAAMAGATAGVCESMKSVKEVLENTGYHWVKNINLNTYILKYQSYSWYTTFSFFLKFYFILFIYFSFCALIRWVTDFM
jgi:hypothetical protein